MRFPRERSAFGERDHNSTRIEASLKDAGFENYLPRMKKEIIHHRNKRVITRTFPLFVGYIFARADDDSAVSRLFQADGVAAVLGDRDHPLPVPVRTVDKIRMAEMALEFDETREAKLKRREIGRTPRRTTELTFPVGTRIVTKAGTLIPGYHGMVTSVTGRRTIKAILDGLEHLEEVELPVGSIERERRPS